MPLLVEQKDPQGVIALFLVAGVIGREKVQPYPLAFGGFFRMDYGRRNREAAQAVWDGKVSRDGLCRVEAESCAVHLHGDAPDGHVDDLARGHTVAAGGQIDTQPVVGRKVMAVVAATVVHGRSPGRGEKDWGSGRGRGSLNLDHRKKWHARQGQES